MQGQKVISNLVGVESEVHVFFQGDVSEELKARVVCMSLAALGELYGCKDNAQNKTCPHSGVSCGGHEYLLNGSRAYWDHGYLEYATPTCMTTSETVAAVLAGDQMIRKAIAELEQTFKKDMRIIAVRNNIDQQGHSFGAHVNIRMTRQGYERIFSDGDILNGYVVPFFVTLPVICGSGRCSSEDGEEVFQIWQRSDFLQELVGLQTTYDRPLVNTRDESLAADSERYARFHIIAFDANRLEIAEFLKLGLLRLLCAAVDADSVDMNLQLDNPIPAIRSISRQVLDFEPIRLASGKSMNALQIQRAFLSAFTKLHEDGVFVGRVEDAADILKRWGQVLTKLEKDPFSLFGSLDWITKYVWLEQIRNDKGLKWTSPQMKRLDIQYHSLTEPPGIPCKHITTDKHIGKLTRKAPLNCRAAIRGKLLNKFGDSISLINWHYFASAEEGNVYLLPDDPKPSLIKIIDKAKTLRKAAQMLKLPKVSLESLEELIEEDNTSELSEVEI